MNKSESIRNLAEALAKFQAKMKTVKKGAINPFYNSTYADLADVIEAYRQPLSEEGLSLAQFPAGKNQIINILMHKSGEFLEEIFEITPTDNRPQSLGSALTYGRRYSAGAILGIATEEDDDGNNANGNKANGEKGKTPAQKEADFKAVLKSIKQLDKKTADEYREKMGKSDLYTKEQKKEYIEALDKHLATLKEVAEAVGGEEKPKEPAKA
jgi:hypothetical protein